MSTIAVQIHGREYRLACDDGQENHLRRIAAEVDSRVRDLSMAMGPQAQENQLLVIASVMMMDELQDLRRDMRRLQETLAAPQDRSEEMAQAEAMLAETLHDIAGRIERIAAKV